VAADLIYDEAQRRQFRLEIGRETLGPEVLLILSVANRPHRGDGKEVTNNSLGRRSVRPWYSMALRCER
jgi:hypothetical protein